MSESKQLDVLNKMTSEVNVGIDEVVSVFVTRYESDLFDRKDVLSTQIRETKKKMSGLDKDLLRLAEAKRSSYEMTNTVLGIKVEVEDVSVYWNDDSDKAQPLIRFKVEVSDTGKRDGYGGSFNKRFDVDIEKSNVETHNSLRTELADLNADLADIMMKIKGVSRKERQVRGKISERKLTQSGYGELLEDGELLKLVTLD